MFWRRRRKRPTEAEQARRAAERALKADRERLDEARTRTAQHRILGRRVLDLYEANHFRESFSRSLRGKV